MFIIKKLRNTQPKLHSSQGGYTILELLVVILIVLILIILLVWLKSSQS